MASSEMEATSGHVVGGMVGGDGSVDIAKLQRQVSRRDAKLLRRDGLIKRLNDRILVLEEESKQNLKKLEENSSEVAIAKETVRTQERTISALEFKLKQPSTRQGKTLDSKFGRGRPKISRWANYHPINNGKRIPSMDNDLQETVVKKYLLQASAERFRLLDAKNSRLEVRKGDLLLLIQGAKCFGYATEAGTNIVVPRSSKLPTGIITSLVDDVNSVVPDVGNFAKRETHAERWFDEFTTKAVYGLYEGLQGPVFLNGRRPIHKAGWASDDNWDLDSLIDAQPCLISSIIRMAMKTSKFDIFAKETQKAALLATLNRLAANQLKMSFSTQPTQSKGRVPRKFHVPEDLRASKESREQNEELPFSPPLVGNADVEAPRIGEPIAPKTKGNVVVQRNSPVQNGGNGGLDLSGNKEEKGSGKKKEKGSGKKEEKGSGRKARKQKRKQHAKELGELSKPLLKKRREKGKEEEETNDDRTTPTNTEFNVAVNVMTRGSADEVKEALAILEKLGPEAKLDL